MDREKGRESERDKMRERNTDIGRNIEKVYSNL